MPIELLNLPISHHPKIHLLAEAFIHQPDSQQSADAWAKQLSLSKHGLERLV